VPARKGPTPRRQPPRSSASNGSKRPAGRAPARSGGQRGRQQATAGRPFLTPGASPLRTKVERRSAAVILFLRGLPRWLPGVGVLCLLGGGLLLPGLAGAALMMVVAAILLWLVYLSWPAVPAFGRLVRLLVVALLAAAAVGRALHRI
jgi:hypothetical protein